MAKKKKVAGKKKKNRSKYYRKNKREEKISFRMTGYLKKSKSSYKLFDTLPSYTHSVFNQ